MSCLQDLLANAEFIRLADAIVEVPGGKNSNNYANVDLIVETAIKQVGATKPLRAAGPLERLAAHKQHARNKAACTTDAVIGHASTVGGASTERGIGCRGRIDRCLITLGCPDYLGR